MMTLNNRALNDFDSPELREHLEEIGLGLMPELQSSLPGATTAEERALLIRKIELVDSRLRGGLELLSHRGDLPGWDEDDGGYEELDVENDRATAVLPLVYEPSNFDCAHGPTIAQAVLNVLGKCIAPDGGLTALESISFRRPTRTALRLQAFRSEAAPPKEGHVYGAVQTAAAGRWCFSAHPIEDRPIQSYRGYHSRAHELSYMAHIQHHADGSIRVPLEGDNTPPADPSGVELATLLLDLAPRFILNLPEAGPMVAVGYAKASATPSLGACDSAPVFQLLRDPNTQDSGRAGLRFINWKFRIWPWTHSWTEMRMAQAIDREQLYSVLHHRT